MCQGLAWEVTEVFCPPLRWCLGRGHAQYSAFALQKWHLGLFGLFVSFVQNLSQLGTHAVILSPIQFLCILLLKE